MYISARYSNAAHTAVIVETDDRGSVALSIMDTPDAWADMIRVLSPEEYAEPKMEPRRLSKFTLIDRLDAAGKLGAAFVALGAPGTRGYERWQASASVDVQNAEVLGLLAAIGCDPVEFLKPETVEEAAA